MHVEMLWTWQSTREQCCEVVIGGRVLPDEWGEEHLPIRVITECQSLFDCSAKDASVPEDRGTALTVASLRERCSAGVGRDQKWVPTRVRLADGLRKSSAGLLAIRSDFWNCSAPRREYESLEEETTHQEFERGSGHKSGANGS